MSGIACVLTSRLCRQLMYQLGLCSLLCVVRIATAFPSGDAVDLPYEVTVCPDDSNSYLSELPELQDTHFCQCKDLHYCIGAGCHRHAVGFDPLCAECTCVSNDQPPRSFHETLSRYQSVHRSIAAGILPMRAIVYSLSSGLSGGLADRLKCIYTCLYFGILTDRAIFINWNFPEPLDAMLLPAAVDWRLPPNLPQTNHKVLLNRGNAPAFVQYMVNADPATPVLNVTANNFPTALMFTWQWDSSFMEGYDIGHGWGVVYDFENPAPGLLQERADELHLSKQQYLVRPAAQFLFRPSAPLADAFKTFLRVHNHPHKYFGVHIRLGGQYNPSFRDTQVRLEDSHFEELMTCAHRVVTELADFEGLSPSDRANVKWFVTGDSDHGLKLAREWLRKKGMEDVMMTTESVVPDAITHMDLTRGGGKRMHNGHLRGFLDYWVLKHAHVIAGVSSGFNLLGGGEAGMSYVWRTPECVKTSLMF